ncbi:MAG: hypothetical protein EXS36_15010, partial [Pedosphaera sp.]|nr:hypothetical protein [Pedosphaera sp.]
MRPGRIPKAYTARPTPSIPHNQARRTHGSRSPRSSHSTIFRRSALKGIKGQVVSPHPATSSWPCPSSFVPPFQRHRGLLGRISTLAQKTITEALQLALNLPKGIPAFVLALHTYGEYLDFHPHVHALVADGLLDSDGTFQLAPEISDRFSPN